MKTPNNQVLSQAPNGNNNGYDYEEMINGLKNLCDDKELFICLNKNGVIKHVKANKNHWLLSRGEELIGQCLWDLLPPENMTKRETRKNVFSRVLESKMPERFEDEHQGHWFDNIVYPICDKQGNVKLVLIMGRDITRRRETEKEMKRLNECLEELVSRRTEEIMQKATKLEELNSTLRVLLQKRDDEKREREQSMVSSINQFIIPHVRQIQKNNTDPLIAACIDAIDTNLKHFNSGFNHSIQSKTFGLTPSEIEVAMLIKAGKSSKDIACIMKISPETVESHRKNIRRKMGLQCKKENLQAYLAALGT